MKRFNTTFFVLFLFLLVNCNVVQRASTDKKSKAVKVWVSTADERKKLTHEADINFVAAHTPPSSTYVVRVDADSTYQRWIGAGGCTNDASSWLMYKKLSKKSKDELMRNFFDKSAGIGLDWVRHQMGSGDAAVINGGWWTYNDMPKGQTDEELKNFSIDMERDYILPTLKEALKINPALLITACPWTPPGWMKTSANDPNPLNHGNIQPKYYQAFANYFIRFIQAYAREGLPIYGISLQNEPLADKQPWQACGIPAVVESNLVKNYFLPGFKKNNITSKIYVFDHNWKGGLDYVSTVYKDPEVYRAVGGSLWHHYEGSPEVMTQVHNRFPDKEIWFTEGCATNNWHNPIYLNYNTYHNSFLNFSYNMIHVPRNWCQTMMMYQLALDPNYGPAVFAPPTNWGMVTINPNTGTTEYRPEYYTLGHVSKFVYPNAYRIKSNQYEGTLETVAFKNPDRSLVLVVSNRKAEVQTLAVVHDGKQFDYIVPAESMVTFTW